MNNVITEPAKAMEAALEPNGTIKPVTAAAQVRNENWTLIIRPKTGWFDLHLAEIWRYRDLIMMYVRRDFVSKYEQTILGPLWFIIQPILTTVTFTLVFGNVAKLSTDGLPKVLFYLSGVTAWTYFSECMTLTSNTFVSHSHTFSKVYFPRLVVPLSFVISNLLRFGIQLGIFLVFYGYFLINRAPIHPTWALTLLPFLVLLMAALALGGGIIVSALTTRYRDLRNLIQFGMQLLMYTTPVIIPFSRLPAKYQWIMLSNPMTPIIETFRYAFLGTGSFRWGYLALSTVVSGVILFLGIVLFSHVEKQASDTV
jgi:lipopolysaccharide transport system permease protein